MIELELRSHQPLSPSQIVALAEAAESAGLHGVSVPDGPDSVPFVVAGALAVRTRRLVIHASGVETRHHSLMHVAMASVTLAALSKQRFVLDIKDGPKGEGISAFDTIGAAAEGQTVEAFGNFRLGGLTPGRIPLFIECSTEANAIEALDHGADGLVLSDLDDEVVVSVQTTRADRVCKIVVLEAINCENSPESITSRVRALTHAGADAIRFVHHQATGPSDLETIMERLRNA